MGFDPVNFTWDYSDDREYGSLQKESRRLSRQNTILLKTVEELNSKMEKLSLVTTAMWQLLNQKVGLDETDLIQQMTALQGKQHDATHCPQCEMTLSSRARNRGQCVFCGEHLHKKKKVKSQN
ncbi:MAG: hypothetical protein K0R12_562 [Gammaproteobacteria bacterium]|jgi:uncharacterized paraquat-inducible protein A|nr:hypothetical protein [Gammaproteobacteria bacterium]